MICSQQQACQVIRSYAMLHEVYMRMGTWRNRCCVGVPGAGVVIGDGAACRGCGVPGAAPLDAYAVTC